MTWSLRESLNMMGIAKNLVHVLGKTFLLSPFLFVIVSIPLTHMLITASSGYNYQTGETINDLMFMDDLKLCLKSEKSWIPLSRH